ncbi:MAG: HEPN domain-containing protein [Candidatus Azobacteroides sp.]|nr:HEPN domain-containing protein [Candidatus Azobacteroides sp.]
MLTEEERDQIVKVRLENVKEAIETAELLRPHGYWQATINRMYYACYYAVTALLIKNQINAQTHAGVRQMLGLHFITSGKLSIEMGDYYRNLFSKRIRGL